MTNYNKGVRLEREVIEIFKKAGYIAFRSAGSHSPFDVVLVKENEINKKICFVAFVQCKISKSNRTEDIAEGQKGDKFQELSKLLQFPNKPI